MPHLEIEFHKGTTRRYRSILHRAAGVDVELVDSLEREAGRAIKAIALRAPVISV